SETSFTFAADFSPLNDRVARLSWPGVAGTNYDILSSSEVTGLSVITNVAGRFPETELLIPYSTNSSGRFFQLRVQ
ncbi:MAG TPA: hypothetical protein VHH73_19635, partial [Verrucomicrobiae bacterium]|nr:hypothetical protein [Verrucomicrobiae bacterium]